MSDFIENSNNFKNMNEFIGYVVKCFNSDENLPNITPDKVKIKKYCDDKDDSLFGSYMINIDGFGTFGFMTKEAYDNLIGKTYVPN